jgi:hypothetical protein
MKLAEILVGAECWGQGYSYRDHRLCLSAAIDRLVWLEAGPGHGAFARILPHWYVLTTHQEQVRLLDVIREVTGSRPARVSEWNDAQERTWTEVAEVVAAYDVARMLA